MCCCCKKAKKADSPVLEVKLPPVSVPEPVPEPTPEPVLKFDVAVIEEPEVQVKVEQEVEQEPEVVVPTYRKSSHSLGIQYISDKTDPQCGKWKNTIYVMEGKKAKEIYDIVKHNQEIELMEAKEAAAESKRKKAKKISEGESDDDPSTASSKENKYNKPAKKLREKSLLLVEHKSSILSLEKTNGVKINVSEPFQNYCSSCTVRAIEVYGNVVENVIKTGHTIEDILPNNQTITYCTTTLNADYERDIIDDHATTKSYTSCKLIDTRRNKAQHEKAKSLGGMKLCDKEFTSNQNYESDMAKYFPIGTYELNPASSLDPTWANIFYVADNDKSRELFLTANNADKTLCNKPEEFKKWCKKNNFQNSFKVLNSFENLTKGETNKAINIKDIEKQCGVSIVVSDVFLKSFDTPMFAIKFLGNSKESVLNAQNALQSNYTEQDCKVSKEIKTLKRDGSGDLNNKIMSSKIGMRAEDQCKYERLNYVPGNLAHVMYIQYPFNYEKYFGQNTSCRIVQSAKQRTQTHITCSKDLIFYRGCKKYMVIIQGHSDESILTCINYLYDAIQEMETAAVEWSNLGYLREYQNHKIKEVNLTDEPAIHKFGNLSKDIIGENNEPLTPCYVGHLAIPKLKVDRGPFFDKNDGRLIQILNRYQCAAKFISVYTKRDETFIKVMSIHNTWYEIQIFGQNLALTKKCIKSVLAKFPKWILVKFSQFI